jgi:hypothetical protein
VPLRLRPFAPEDEIEARRAHAELDEDGFPFLLGWDPVQSWAGYLRQRADRRAGVDLPPGWVPSTSWARSSASSWSVESRSATRSTLS